MSPDRWRVLAPALASMLLSGCAALWPAPYGEVAADADPVRGPGLPNLIPANAPSTLNGHWADYGGHQGIDVLGDVGLPVLAPAAGRVVASRFEPMYGHRIEIDHGDDGDGNAVRSLLVHLDERLVGVGETVRRGQQVARLGRTGLLAGAIPHLHFEIRTRAPGRYRIFEPRNPNLYWVDGAGIITCFDRARRYPAAPFAITYPVPCRGVDWE
ncbi:MAG: M23 family metallopeptidase [Gammaproteobacteria bacterium]|nr:M23 family metallopeptidase [Gammaproteobacteria bacterium]